MSSALVLHHTWDAVREVLIHEMAHQFAHEVLGAANAPAHGPQFQEACHLLRANPRASGSYPTLHERISGNGQSEKDRILLRIHKLLALAESKNRHEAESAMTKAHHLIAKYNVDVIVHHQERDFESIFLGKPALRHFREDYHLAGLLQDFYFVFGLWVSAYVFEKEKMGRVLEITGTARNVQMAAYVYDFVRHFIDSQWIHYNRNRRFNRYRKTDFAVGIIEGFRSKLERNSQTNRHASTDRVLMKIEDPLLVAYTGHKYPHTKSFRPKAAGRDPAVARDGRRIGRDLVISKGITEKGVSRKALIEDSSEWTEP